MCEDEQTIAWSTRTGLHARHAPRRRAPRRERGWYAQPPERPRRLRPARGRRPLAMGAGALPHRARRRRAAPRGGRAHRARRRARSWPRRATRRRGPDDAALPLAPVGDARRRRWRCSFVFFLVPIGVAAYESLFSWDLLTPPRFVGAANYRALAAHGELLRIALRTLGYSAFVVAGTMSLGLALALLVNRPGRFFALRARERLQRLRRQLGGRRAALDVAPRRQRGVVGRARRLGLAARRPALGAAGARRSSASGSSPGTR